MTTNNKPKDKPKDKPQPVPPPKVGGKPPKGSSDNTVSILDLIDAHRAGQQQ